MSRTRTLCDLDDAEIQSFECEPTLVDTPRAISRSEAEGDIRERLSDAFSDYAGQALVRGDWAVADAWARAASLAIGMLPCPPRGGA